MRGTCRHRSVNITTWIYHHAKDVNSEYDLGDFHGSNVNEKSRIRFCQCVNGKKSGQIR